MLPKKRPPTSAGEMLIKEFIKPMGMTQVTLAKHLGWTRARLNEIVNGRWGSSANSALAFGQAFGTGPEFWLNLQRDWDPWHEMKKHKPVAALKKAS